MRSCGLADTALIQRISQQARMLVRKASWTSGKVQDLLVLPQNDIAAHRSGRAMATLASQNPGEENNCACIWCSQEGNEEWACMMGIRLYLFTGKLLENMSHMGLVWVERLDSWILSQWVYRRLDSPLHGYTIEYRRKATGRRNRWTNHRHPIRFLQSSRLLFGVF
jgi:hypothetical protein